jgi:ribose 5-phosphate isomerase
VTLEAFALDAIRPGHVVGLGSGRAAEVGPLSDPAGLDRALHAIPGVLETGLFLGLRAAIAVERPDGLEIRTP